ncbi:aspartate aminotransferase family protein [Methylobacterium sp. E-005]|uniref:aspartate aminotransferase family protein n=1 Tax=Methylobacterium sp. E-005 TaxID=2836549 RepID=UPI001FBBC242|nr:aspartate aminotransferase family protein [Methylobacterium sp. E-005]MCJ2085402.1 aspartate aminotransferase family protein [Methylobacterium sp. E-005]
MTFMPNSVEARDIAYQLHPLVDLRNYDKTGALVIERGEGIYVYDNAGRRYIEGLAGLWSVAVGFGERRLSDAAKRQMDQLSYYHIFAHKTHGPSVDLAEKLIGMAPVPMSKVHFTSSGSEANDLVVKLAWYRSNALGKPEKKKIIGRLKGYHGVTIAAGSITGLPRNHESFDLPLDRMRHVSCPDYAGSALPGETEAAFSRRMADELEKLILAEGPDTVAAFFGEPVMASGGVYVPPENYWAEIQKVLRRYDVLLVADEVICGFGRTGAMFGCETFGIEPDVMVLSKQISSSYMPLSAILMNANFYDPIADESARLGVFGHGYTASGHPVATAVGLENIRIIEERDLVGNCRRLSPLFLERLAGLAEHPLAKTWRGVGLIGALELKPATAPGAKPGAAGAALQAAALEQGVIARAIGDSLCFCPPLIITAEQIGAMFDAVGRALDTIAA